MAAYPKKFASIFPAAALRACGWSPLPIFLCLVSGCSTAACRFEIVDHRAGDGDRRYTETFDEAYYDLDGRGNVDIVLRRRQASEAEPADSITQVIHIRSVWRPIPGQTVAGKTQINGCVSYIIVGGRSGATFEGAGSVFFSENEAKGTLTGTLDQASLRPVRRLAGGSSLFERAELSGAFQAHRDKRNTARIINEMNRLFGPLPTYRPDGP